MPIHFHHSSSTDITTVRLSGLLTRLDYRRIMPYLESLVVDYGKLKLLLVFEDFEGWAPPELQGEALRSFGNLSEISCLAICSGHEWHMTLKALSLKAGCQHVKLFSLSEEQFAEDWILSVKEPPFGKILNAI